MGQAMQLWGEILFNVLYLIIVWGLVVAMIRQRPQLPAQEQRLARLFIWAFALLALGDTGHVGFRILAYALGDLETVFRISGLEVGLVGIGVFSTSVTVTLFYMLMLLIWRERFQKPYGWLGTLAYLAAAARLGLMWQPQNEWNRIVSPMPWTLYRNLPLMVLGLGVACLMLRDAIRRQDPLFSWIGVLIIVSFAFYLPVILLVEAVPAIGMLMIPKTIAYVAIASLAYRAVFRKASLNHAPAPS